MIDEIPVEVTDRLVKQVINDVVGKLLEQSVIRLLGERGYESSHVHESFRKFFIAEAERLIKEDAEVKQAFRDRLVQSLKTRY